jgi:hypothetical protein
VPMIRRYWPVAALLLFGVGCAPAGEQPAMQVANDFATALADADAQRACELLAPDTADLLESMSTLECEQALPALELPGGEMTEVQVWGDAAQARSADDVVFLRELDGQWVVVAAGCQEQEGGEPYQCDLQGS